jgi:hypothetical protein
LDTFIKIRDIFYSGSHAFTGSYESINEISFLINEGFLTFDTISIARKKEYFTLLDNLLNYNNNQAGEAVGGSNEHIALKILAQNISNKKRVGILNMNGLFVVTIRMC